ncbi:Copper-containing nitrite reductase [Calidithermus terrae]|uniref:Copper-containing nitrite reductase n=1 Tax=Calidithermus terrae TaxID=1408545 RepID=A0A399F018_9DEIN|nr:multicopper oxidase domain-containing protein [Calidithermus terrae]RIH88649.1 Copper-containing nitrite reductase [Calidithermus terrae]
MRSFLPKLFSRRQVLRSLGGVASVAGAAALGLGQGSKPAPQGEVGGHSGHYMGAADPKQMGHGNNLTVGAVDHQANGFDPLRLLVDWDYGKVSTLPSGQTLREYEFVAQEKEIEIAPGVFFPAWTYNGRVPGPTIRCTEGDRIRVRFTNSSSHPHTIHFHGIHPAEMDGTPLPGNGGLVQPGQSFTYEFTAEPFGCHLYHCHSLSLKRHIHKGMYGAFVVDPKGGRPPAREFVMVMNAFDTNFDGGNEVYAVNSVAFEYARRAIPLKLGELVRIYLINVLEFDPINTFHLHANMFDYYDHGTTLEPTLRRVDTISQVQGQRGIVEFRYKFPGMYMFHPHVSEFTELGWMGHFNVVRPEDFAQALQSVGLDAAWDQKSLQGSTVPWKGGEQA